MTQETKFIRFDVSDPHFHAGNKYYQKITGYTRMECNPYSLPSVVETDNQGGYGVRMEDAAAVKRISDDQFIVTLADGHGPIAVIAEPDEDEDNVPLYSGDTEEEDKEPINPSTRYVGARECALLCVEESMRYLSKRARTLRISDAKSVGETLVDAFSRTQRICAEQIEQGARRDTEHQGNKKEAENRRRLLVSNSIDGPHFSDMYVNPRLIRNIKDKKILVIDKILRPYKDGRVVFYQGEDGNKTIPVDFGCTLTAVLGLPPIALPDQPPKRTFQGQATAETKKPPASPPPPRARLYVAHAGDSDVYLFTRKGPGDLYQPSRLCAQHSVHSKTEVERLSKTMRIDSDYFTPNQGTYEGKFKIMPSRSLGHSILRHEGITHVPDTYEVADVRNGDVIVVASDGLWQSYGKNFVPFIPYSSLSSFSSSSSYPKKPDETMTAEDRSAWKVASFLDSIRKNSSIDRFSSNYVAGQLINDIRPGGAVIVDIHKKKKNSEDNLVLFVIICKETTTVT
jgi:serine/threonine protein phosphatase PrpC